MHLCPDEIFIFTSLAVSAKLFWIGLKAKWHNRGRDSES